MILHLTNIFLLEDWTIYFYNHLYILHILSVKVRVYHPNDQGPDPKPFGNPFYICSYPAYENAT
jgi:hypothetical protein